MKAKTQTLQKNGLKFQKKNYNSQADMWLQNEKGFLEKGKRKREKEKKKQIQANISLV